MALQEANIARKLNITRQTVHQTIDTATSKIGEALEETAKINKIEIQTVDPIKGFLLGYSNHFKTRSLSLLFQPKMAFKSGISMRAIA